MEKFSFFNKFKDAVIVANQKKEVVYTNRAFKRCFWDYNDFKRFSHKLSYDFYPFDAEDMQSFLPMHYLFESKEDFDAFVNYQDSKGEFSFYNLSAYKRGIYTIMIFSDVSAEVELERVKAEKENLVTECSTALKEVERLRKTAQSNQAQAVKMTLINKISNIIRESIDSD